MKTKFTDAATVSVIALLLSATASADQDSRSTCGSSLTAAAQTEAARNDQGLFARSPDGSLFATAHRNGRIMVGSVADGRIIRTFYHCHPQGLAFSKEGAWLTVTGGNQFSFTVNLANGQVLERRQGPVEAIPEAIQARDRATLISERRRAERAIGREKPGSVKEPGISKPQLPKIEFGGSVLPSPSASWAHHSAGSRIAFHPVSAPSEGWVAGASRIYRTATY